MRKKLISMPYRRKAEGKTDYRKRMTLLMSGKPRLVVRRSHNHMLVQVIEYHEDGDKVLATAHSSELKKLGWKYGTGNLPSSYLVGLLAGKKALSKGVAECIVDLGLQSPVAKSGLYAAVKGAVDSGMAVPHSKESFPDENRLTGKHISDFKSEGNQFSRYRKDNLRLDGITAQFKELKDRIMKV